MTRAGTFVATLMVLLALPGGVGADSSRTRRARIDRFLVSVAGEGVFLYDLKGQAVWSYRCDPYDAVDAGRGQILITERRTGRVFRVTREGKVTWQKDGLRGPVNAEPLDNGGVLVVENDSGSVLEIGPGGDIVREIAGHQTPFDARRRPNGNTIVADSGNHRVIEYDPSGRKLHQTAGLNFPNSVCALPEGRTLFTTYTAGTIGELDAAGTVVWERKIGGTLYAVAAEGDALWVADGVGGRVVHLTRDGRILQEIKIGKTFLDLAFCR